MPTLQPKQVTASPDGKKTIEGGEHWKCDKCESVKLYTTLWEAYTHEEAHGQGVPQINRPPVAIP